MTKDEALRVLGLRPEADATRIREVYEAQAAALDARIAAASGDDVARYRRDREEVELARLALLGSTVKPPAPKPSPKKDDPLTARQIALAILLGPCVYLVMVAGYAWFNTPVALEPIPYAITALFAAFVLLALGAVYTGIFWVVGRLLGRREFSPPATSFVILVIVGWHFIPTDRSTMAKDLFEIAILMAFAWLLVCCLVYIPLGFALGVFKKKAE